MGIIIWIIFGALAGWVASMVMGSGGGLMWDVAVGIIGAVIGSGCLVIGIIPGTLLGIFLGAFVLEWLVKRDWKQSLKSGIGSLVGRVGSIAAKFIVVLCMFAVMGIQLLHR